MTRPRAFLAVALALATFPLAAADLTPEEARAIVRDAYVFTRRDFCYF